MQRSTAVLLVAGATVLFVILGVLVRAVHSEAPATGPATTTRTSSTGSHESAGSSTAGNGPIASRDPSNHHQVWRTPMFASENNDSSGEAAPAVHDDNAPPATRGNTKNLEYGGTQLREQTMKVSIWVQRCVEDAKKQGLAPSGTAILTYVVAKHGDKYEVEDTGIDEDKTTLQGTELLDCLRTTALAMHFEGLPREATGIVATRSVTLEAGKLVEYKHVGFSYLR